MIDPKELRLGNLILSETKAKPVYVTHRIISDLASHAPLPYEPIPITYDLLLQLGFIDPAKNGWGCRISVNSMDEICWYLLDNSVRYQTQLSGFTRHLDHIKYVHQLQNLFFALTGEELTVKEKV